MASSFSKIRSIREEVSLKIVLCSVGMGKDLSKARNLYSRSSIDIDELVEILYMAATQGYISQDEDHKLSLTTKGLEFLKSDSLTGERRKDCFWIQYLPDHLLNPRSRSKIYIPSQEVIEELDE